MNQIKVPQVVRWVARGMSVLVAGFVLVMFFGEAGGLSVLFRNPAILWIPIPVVGLMLAWRWELIGGMLALAWLPSFYAREWILSGGFPKGPWFAMMALPSLFFLLAWFLTPAQREARI